MPEAAPPLTGSVSLSALVEKVVRHEDLTEAEASAAMREVMEGRAAPGALAGLLTALAMKGERPHEIVGFARTMREHAVQLSAPAGDVFDTCGTGGDRAGTFNVSSTAGKRPSTGMPHYSVTKAAVLSLSRLVADLYAKDGVRSNAVTPGPTATDAWLGEGGLAEQQGDRDEILARVAAGRPLGRLADPEEAAAVIVFLCSERASYVTGAAWSADGGTVPIIL